MLPSWQITQILGSNSERSTTMCLSTSSSVTLELEDCVFKLSCHVRVPGDGLRPFNLGKLNSPISEETRKISFIHTRCISVPWIWKLLGPVKGWCDRCLVDVQFPSTNQWLETICQHQKISNYWLVSWSHEWIKEVMCFQFYLWADQWRWQVLQLTFDDRLDLHHSFRFPSGPVLKPRGYMV